MTLLILTHIAFYIENDIDNFIYISLKWSF